MTGRQEPSEMFPLADWRARIERNAKLRPGLRRAVRGDAVSFAGHRGEQWHFPGKRDEWRAAFRLFWTSEDFAAVAMYRLETKLRASRVPIVPWILHRLCVHFFGIRIGQHLVIGEGLYVPHGNIVLDGIVSIGQRCVVCPWVTVGVKQGDLVGPRIGDGVFIGTGAKIIGDIRIGHRANIGAGAVVIDDVPDGASVAGVPARVVGRAEA